MTETNKHDWRVYENRHPFLTGWECCNCGLQLMIEDNQRPDEMDESKSIQCCRKPQDAKDNLYAIVWVGLKTFYFCYNKEDVKKYVDMWADTKNVLVLKPIERYDLGKKTIVS